MSNGLVTLGKRITRKSVEIMRWLLLAAFDKIKT